MYTVAVCVECPSLVQDERGGGELGLCIYSRHPKPYIPNYVASNKVLASHSCTCENTWKISLYF